MTRIQRGSAALAAAALAGLSLGACTEGRVDDATISANVRSHLASSPELQGTSIGVASNDAKVVLTGRVLSDEQRAEAEDLAEDVSGVKDVENRLVVASDVEPMPGSPPDFTPPSPPVAAPPPAPDDMPRQ